MNNNIRLAQNLKTLRKQLGLSRKQLAEKINYTDKAIEKWETGQSTPPLPIICQVAQVLGVRLEELVYEKTTAPTYFLGIDGGGTKTSFRLEDAGGTILAESIGGASNPNDVGIQRCEEILRSGIAEVTAGINLAEVAVFAGLAGGMSGDNGEKIQRILAGLNCGYAACGSDVENAMELCLRGGDGVMIIAGTGSIAFAQKNGERHRIGGWGYLLDGDGSGYGLGRGCLTAVYRAIDGRGEPTLLTRLVEEYWHKPPTDAIPDIYTGGKRLIASLAPLVFEADDQGDAVAAAILEQNAAHIAELIRHATAHVDDPTAPVVICGGLANQGQRLEPLIRKHLDKDYILQFNTQPIVKGAIMCARRLYEQH